MQLTISSSLPFHLEPPLTALSCIKFAELTSRTRRGLPSGIRIVSRGKGRVDYRQRLVGTPARRLCFRIHATPHFVHDLQVPGEPGVIRPQLHYLTFWAAADEAVCPAIRKKFLHMSIRLLENWLPQKETTPCKLCGREAPNPGW
jgi:hypothetical protein